MTHRPPNDSWIRPDKTLEGRGIGSLVGMVWSGAPRARKLTISQHTYAASKSNLTSRHLTPFALGFSLKIGA